MDNQIDTQSDSGSLNLDQKKVSWFGIEKVILLLLLIWVLENISYFYVAEYFGNYWGVDNTANLQLPIDRIIPWVTILYPFYICWPFTWVFVIAALICKGGGLAFSRFTINNIMMYIVGSVIYAYYPTTTAEMEFVVGPIQTLDKNALFYDQIYQLASSTDNIWGSFPSYHNYFASLLVFFGVFFVTSYWRKITMISLGLLITISTLTLHQHCVLDVVLTYTLTASFLFITIKTGWDKKLLQWINQTVPRSIRKKENQTTQ